ncbi:MAG: hypothetical protein RRC34_15820 [Lentisphaeria bacterium]|nr:hypothetical protein [Lentisphaeria bacterium]
MTPLRRFLLHVCRFSAACGLLFLTLVFVSALIRLPLNFDSQRVVLPLVGGFAGGLIFVVFISRLPVLYVFGHELTHWVAAKCFLRETGAMKISGGSGHVHVERPNVWIVLAPYFIPLYSLAWTGFYGLTRMIWRQPRPGVVIAFNIGLGVTCAYHGAMTVYALSRAQSDLKMHGIFFSLSLILCCNTGLLLFCLIVASGQWGQGWRLTSDFFLVYAAAAADSAASVFHWARTLLN